MREDFTKFFAWFFNSLWLTSPQRCRFPILSLWCDAIYRQIITQVSDWLWWDQISVSSQNSVLMNKWFLWKIHTQCSLDFTGTGTIYIKSLLTWISSLVIRQKRAIKLEKYGKLSENHSMNFFWHYVKTLETWMLLFWWNLIVDADGHVSRMTVGTRATHIRRRKWRCSIPVGRQQAWRPCDGMELDCDENINNRAWLAANGNGIAFPWWLRAVESWKNESFRQKHFNDAWIWALFSKLSLLLTSKKNFFKHFHTLNFPFIIIYSCCSFRSRARSPQNLKLSSFASQI